MNACKYYVTQLQWQCTTALGPSLVAWHAWQQLGLPALPDTLEFNLAQAQAAAVSVISGAHNHRNRR
jgi:hypothetical protein